MISSYLQKHKVLSKINEQVRFARKRFGRYEIIDFLAVLFGYAISGERTLEEFYQRLQPFAVPFMALFDRDQLPARSTLSRFLVALTEAPVEALRTLFLDDLLERPLTLDKQTGSLLDRTGYSWMVFDIDGTREAARQRALPQTEDLPPPTRRLDDVCAPGYRGRKRGEVVRTRTTISQAHSYHWLGSFGNRGNGRYREELRQGLAAIGRYLAAYQLPQERALVRLDGLYGSGAVLSDLGRFAGQDFALQPDGTLRCPAGQKLTPHEQRREADGSLRVVYGASIHSCRSCTFREQCQWNGGATKKPRQVSVLLHPLAVGDGPLLWRDWSRRVHRLACMQLTRQQRIEMSLSPPTASPPIAEVILSRAQRAHSRLSRTQRLACNARPATAGQVTVRLYGVPAAFALSLGLATA